MNGTATLKMPENASAVGVCVASTATVWSCTICLPVPIPYSTRATRRDGFVELDPIDGF